MREAEMVTLYPFREHDSTDVPGVDVLEREINNQTLPDMSLKNETETSNEESLKAGSETKPSKGLLISQQPAIPKVEEIEEKTHAKIARFEVDFRKTTEANQIKAPSDASAILKKDVISTNNSGTNKVDQEVIIPKKRRRNRDKRGKAEVLSILLKVF